MGDDDTAFFYFGCIGHSGHYLWSAPYRQCRDVGTTPWGFAIDGKLCPITEGRQREGVASVHHKDGWTALAFWDRSIDSRPGSNSVFLAGEYLSFDEMVALAKSRFPDVWKRYSFDVTDSHSSVKIAS